MIRKQKMPLKKLGKLIIESITGEQLATLLDLICSPPVLLSVMGELEKMDADLAKTIEKIVTHEEEPPGDTGLPEIASEKKTLERWQALWKEWDALVSEVGNEHGRYAEQDEEWHPPYFNGYGFANDLEPIAENMLESIEEVFAPLDEPDLFRDSIAEIGHGIDSYPEWMGGEYGEECELGEIATLCVLKWTWLACEEAQESGGAFLEKVHEVERTHGLVSLEDETMLDFFISLPDAACRAIYKAFTQNPSKYEVDKTRTRWHRIFHHYEKKYDAASYLDTCREHLPEDWRYGEPLIEDALESGDYKAAENYLEHTFSALLRGGEKKMAPWDPPVD